jgi:hypothetical protein
LLSAVPATLVSGGWFLLQGAITSIGTICIAPSNPCARIEPLLNAWDAIEQFGLQAKLAYQSGRGDPAAADTALELQMEQLDGNMPGNTTAMQIADLGEDAVELIRLYGDDAIPLLLKYGEEAIDIIGAYGDDGIEILQKYGPGSIDLIKGYGNDALDIIGAYGDDGIEILQKYGSDAVYIIGT